MNKKKIQLYLLVNSDTDEIKATAGDSVATLRELLNDKDLVKRYGLNKVMNNPFYVTRISVDKVIFERSNFIGLKVTNLLGAETENFSPTTTEGLRLTEALRVIPLFNHAYGYIGRTGRILFVKGSKLQEISPSGSDLPDRQFFTDELRATDWIVDQSFPRLKERLGIKVPS